MLKRLLLLKQIPSSPDLTRLCLRVVLIGSLFLKHGTEKLFTYGTMQQVWVGDQFDPVHIGTIPTLLFAALSDGICTVLIVFGLFTRLASAIVFINLFVAWAIVHHGMYFGKDPHGEVIVLYMAGALALFLGGAGKYSVDALIDKPAEEETGTSSESSQAQA